MNEREAIYTLVWAGHTVSYHGNFRVFNGGHDVFIVKDFLNGKTYSFPDRLEDAIDKYLVLIAEREEEQVASNHQG